MEISEAFAVLETVINAAIKAGIFQDSASVVKVADAITAIKRDNADHIALKAGLE